MTIWKNLYQTDSYGYVEWWLVYGVSNGLLVDAFKATKGVRTGWVERTPYNFEVGRLGRSFGYDFFNRIHINTNTINFNNLVGTQIFTVHVWSAFFSNQTLTDTLLVDAEGIFLTGGEAPPFDFTPLHEISWIVTGTQVGPPIIDGSLTLTFGGVTEYTIPMVGRRVLLWEWDADWSSSVLERLEWKTDVIQSYDGTEQRRKLRMNPKRSMEFGVMETATARRTLETMLWGWSNRVWAVPIHTDVRDTSAKVFSGDLFIPFSRDDTLDYSVGSFLILKLRESGVFDICEVASLESGGVSVVRPLVFDWEAGTKVYPGRPARLQSFPTLDRETDDIITSRVIFEFEDPQQWSQSFGAVLHKGYPVVTFKHNWVERPSISYSEKATTFYPSIGTKYIDSEAPIPAPIIKAHYTFKDRTEIDAWRQFIHAAKGKWSSVWVRSFANDLELVAPCLSSEITLTVRRTSYHSQVALDPSRKDVRIELHDGSIFIRRLVSSAEVDSVTETVAMEASLGVDIDATNVREISFLSLVRFNSDAVELSWVTDSIAESTVEYIGFTHVV